jgi:hypothetical protein
MRTRLKISRHGGLFREWRKNALLHKKAGEETFLLKQHNKITKYVPRKCRVSCQEMHRGGATVNLLGFK